MDQYPNSMCLDPQHCWALETVRNRWILITVRDRIKWVKIFFDVPLTRRRKLWCQTLNFLLRLGIVWLVRYSVSSCSGSIKNTSKSQIEQIRNTKRNFWLRPGSTQLIIGKKGFTDKIKIPHLNSELISCVCFSHYKLFTITFFFSQIFSKLIMYRC